MKLYILLSTDKVHDLHLSLKIPIKLVVYTKIVFPFIKTMHVKLSVLRMLPPWSRGITVLPDCESASVHTLVLR